MAKIKPTATGTAPSVERRLEAPFIEFCLERAGRFNCELSADAFAVPGMTSLEIRALLNNLCSRGSSYCEIGALLGATAVAAAYGNTGRFLTVDDFSAWPKPEGGAFIHLADNPAFKKIAHLSTRDACLENIRAAGCQVELIEQDCFAWEPDFQVEILFYDGDHHEEATYRALTELRAKLQPRLVIVDDFGSEAVQAAVKRAGLPVEQEWTRPWWNGIYLALVG